MATFMRGAKPSPGHKLMAMRPFSVMKAPPTQFAVVPQKLSMWGNGQYGDCVSAEEAWAKAWWSTFCGLPETFVTEADVIAWARKHGYLNGADLIEVMDAMAKDGMPADGKVWTDGPHLSVDYSNDLILQSAISQGAVKIAIDADALPSGAGNVQGWFATQKGNYRNIDHCVGLGAYGRADFLFDALKVSLPSGLSASTIGYILYTWSTHGFVTLDWVIGCTQEAYWRNPTTPGQSPGPPPPPPPPPPPNPPTPVVAPKYHGTMTGTMSGALGAKYPFTGTIDLVPVASHDPLETVKQ